MDLHSGVDQLLEYIDASSDLPDEDRLLGIPSSFTGIDLAAIQDRLDKHRKALKEKLGREIHPAAALLDLLDADPEGSTIDDYCLLKKRALHDLVQTALYDSLTGLYSRNVLEDRLQEEFRRARRYNLPLSVLFIDLDGFKVINDTYGHLEGNRVLSYIGQFIRDRLREVDFPVRYGGEEFLIILPHTNGETALRLARRIHKGIGKAQKEADLPTTVTLSIGVGSLAPIMQIEDQLIDAADRAVYKAKQAGKDRVWPIVNADPQGETAPTSPPPRSET